MGRPGCFPWLRGLGRVGLTQLRLLQARLELGARTVRWGHCLRTGDADRSTDKPQHTYLVLEPRAGTCLGTGGDVPADTVVLGLKG